MKQKQHEVEERQFSPCISEEMEYQTEQGLPPTFTGANHMQCLRLLTQNLTEGQNIQLKTVKRRKKIIQKRQNKNSALRHAQPILF